MGGDITVESAYGRGLDVHGAAADRRGRTGGSDDLITESPAARMMAATWRTVTFRSESYALVAFVTLEPLEV